MAETTKTSPAKSAPTEPTFQFFKVRSSFPTDRKRVLFRSISETRARNFIANRFPRGEEAYLEHPDGTTESYAQERAGEHGEDMNQWQPFDPESWKPPEEQEPPGQTAWGDVEG
jgi:hypothetical protein